VRHLSPELTIAIGVLLPPVLLIWLKTRQPISVVPESAIPENGNGYVFIHRLLREHFAELEIDE